MILLHSAHSKRIKNLPSTSFERPRWQSGLFHFNPITQVKEDSP